MKINVTTDIQIPQVPLFFFTKEGEQIPICAAEEEELRKIGEQWTLDLINRAHQQSKETRDDRHKKD